MGSYIKITSKSWRFYAALKDLNDLDIRFEPAHLNQVLGKRAWVVEVDVISRTVKAELQPEDAWYEIVVSLLAVRKVREKQNKEKDGLESNAVKREQHQKEAEQTRICSPSSQRVKNIPQMKIS